LIAIAVASFVLRMAVYQAGYQNDPWLSRFFPHELGLFVMGMLARRFYDAYIEKIPGKAQWGIVIAFFAVTAVMRTIMEAVDPAGIQVQSVIWPYYLSAIVAVPCLFHLTRHSAWDGKLGNYSYPVYLAHWVVLSFYDAFAPHWGLPLVNTPLAWVRVLICVAATFALAWLVIVSVEVPVNRYRQRRAAAALT
jgi:peptidoglycan/LPS O-acetylase OafA/YrhL